MYLFCNLVATTRSQGRGASGQGSSRGGQGSFRGGRGRRGRSRCSLSSSPLDKGTESAIIEVIADGE